MNTFYSKHSSFLSMSNDAAMMASRPIQKGEKQTEQQKKIHQSKLI